MKKIILLNLVVLVALSVADAAVVEFPLNCGGAYSSGQSWTTDFNLGVAFAKISNVYIDWSGTIAAEKVCQCGDANTTTWPVDGKFVVRLNKSNYYYEIANTYIRAGAATYPKPEPFELRSALPELNYEPGELLVHFADPTLTVAERNALLASFGGGMVMHSFSLVPGLSLVELPLGVTVQEALAALENAPGILYAHPNGFVYPADTGWQDWSMFLDGCGTIEIEFGKIYRPLDLCTVEYPTGRLHSATLVFEGTPVSIRLVPDEYATIQAAIDDCNHRDVVVVAPGIYRGGGNCNIDFKGKTITVRSEKGPDSCVIDCEHRGRGFYFHSGENARSVLDGFTIINGYANSGGGIFCYYSGSPGRFDTILGSSASYDGFGMPRPKTNPTIINCVITSNSARYGGGILCFNSNPTITNCTITGNSATTGGGIKCYDKSRPTITNCILWSNLDSQIQGSAVVTYSNIEGGWPGEGNIHTDPCFVSPGYWDVNGVWVDGDYHLLQNSPCIDAGDPNYLSSCNETDLDGKPRIIGGRIDMGAYEYSTTIPAEVRITPRTINLASKGNWIICYIWLPEDYNVADIDPNSVFLEEQIQPEQFSVDEQAQLVTTKFTREDVQPILEIGDIELKITGLLIDGTWFEATDTIKVVDKAEKN